MSRYSRKLNKKDNMLSREESRETVDSATTAGIAIGGQRRRKDGTVNKMSFDVDELEEGLYEEIEDDENVEEVPAKTPVDSKTEAVGRESIAAHCGGGGENEANEITKAKSTLTEDTPEEFKIRPDLNDKFRPGFVQVLIESVIKDKLEGKKYSGEECEVWVQQILDEIHSRVKSENYKRYKLISQVTLGERQGEGVSSATRCLWDAEADCMATYTFLNDTIFCNGTVYGIYFY